MSASPALTPSQAAWALLTPRRTTRLPTQNVVELWNHARWIDITAEARVHISQAGEGPVAALVHGWEGSADDFSAIASALVSHGYSVMGLDLPAHGQSDGVWTSIPACVQVLLEVQHALKCNFQAVIGHSYGAAVIGEALAAGLRAERAVLISPPRRFMDGVREFAKRLGFDEANTQAFVAALREIGVDPDPLDLPLTVSRLSVPALILHSDNDSVIPIAAARSVAEAWRGSRFVELAGCGHRRLLGEPAVAERIVTFLSGDASTA